MICFGSTYESSDKAISLISSLSWLSPNYLRVWISPWQYCSKSVATANEACHLLFRVTNLPELACEKSLLNLLNLLILTLRLFAIYFVDTQTLDWIYPTIWCWILSREKVEKGRSCSCFLIIFHVRIHGIISLEQNVRNLDWLIN